MTCQEPRLVADPRIHRVFDKIRGLPASCDDLGRNRIDDLYRIDPDLEAPPLEVRDRKTMWKRIAGTLIISAAVLSATSILLWDRYAQARPPNPDVATGRIHHSIHMDLSCI